MPHLALVRLLCAVHIGIALPRGIAAETGGQRDDDRKEKEMQKYECTVCGYVYDPTVGDPDSGVPANTAFGDLPADWVCPECGAEKDMFEAVS